MTLDEAVASFGEYLLDDDRTEFTFQEAEGLAEEVGLHPTVVIRSLKTYGFSMQTRVVAKSVRGYRTNSHDRYYGPGSSKMHGGSGHKQITGFSGQEG